MSCPGYRRKPIGYPSLLLGAKKERKTNEEQKNFFYPTSCAVILISVPSDVDTGRAMKVGGDKKEEQISFASFSSIITSLSYSFCFLSLLPFSPLFITARREILWVPATVSPATSVSFSTKMSNGATPVFFSHPSLGASAGSDPR